MKELFLVFVDTEFSESYTDKGGSDCGAQSQKQMLRGVADSEAAAVGLIVKDYLDTLTGDSLDPEEFPLLPVTLEYDEGFEVNINGAEDSGSWSQKITWYVHSAVINELFEEE